MLLMTSGVDMKKELSDAALKELFLEARSFNRFSARPVEDELLKRLYGLLKWGPTAQNCQPARYVFIKSDAGRDRLIPTLQPGNVDKVKSAPVTVIVAYDSRFFEHLATQWPAYDAAGAYAENTELAHTVAFRNGSLQGAYLIMAARSLGLDCGPMSGFSNHKVNAEFFPDGRFRSNFLVCLGYGTEEKLYPRGPRLAFEDVAKII